jgi:sugar O-acyltransferase (sialic acid O-acetyltransferase NeuD family)
VISKKGISLNSRQKPVLLLGLGGHAKVLINILRLRGYDIIGALSPDPLATNVMDVSVIGDDNELGNFNPIDIKLVNALGHLPNSNIREILFKVGKKNGFSFASVIHPSAIVANEVKLGEGVQVMAGAIIEPAVEIGDNSIVNTSACVNHDTTIGAHSHVAPGVVICGGVTVGKGAFIGAGASLLPDANIKDGAFIKAAQLVGPLRLMTSVKGLSRD